MPARKAPILFAANSSWNLLNFRRPIISALLNSDHSVAAAVPNDGGAESLTRLGVAVHFIPMSPHAISPVEDIRLLIAYFRLMKQMRPAAFLGFTIKPNIYGSIAATRLGVPTFNTVSGLGTSFLSGRVLQMFALSAYRFAFSRSRRVFFHNPDDRNLFLSHRVVRSTQAVVVPGSGIDLKHFYPTHRPEGTVEPTFIFIGRLLSDKGAIEFAEAASRVRNTRQARFLMLGSADNHPKAVTTLELERYVATGAIQLLGETDDVRPYIQQADCVVLPSYREGFPRVLLEASAMAKPVITTDVPGCRHAVEHGSTGLLCSPRSSQSLADAMMSFLDMPPDARRAMGQRGRRKAVLDFSEELVISAYLDALEDRSNR